ncbi:hypothetical protein [Oenococcus kitaharae]|uniref:hypothetical protein n=1 Tax=Oenococcus kitaharae TaxID=336988 RepID=UPI0004873BC9|nr:hypothetical protein [Oenococcus kitaharae]
MADKDRKILFVKLYKGINKAHLKRISSKNAIKRRGYLASDPTKIGSLNFLSLISFVKLINNNGKTNDIVITKLILVRDNALSADIGGWVDNPRLKEKNQVDIIVIIRRMLYTK